MSALKDLTGQTFERLTVLKRAENTNAGRARWHCKCDCGNETISRGGDLRSGGSTSCGCLTKERVAQANTRTKTTHGMWKTPEYTIWGGIKNRCNNPKDKDYDKYGGRGISMSSEWENSFSTFMRDMGTRTSKTHTVERIDNNGDYCKSNCKWATRKEQANNRRNSQYVEYQGKTFTISQFSRRLGVKDYIVRYRIGLGWSTERIAVIFGN